MKKEKFTGIMFIIGVIGVLIPYTILTMIFNYPLILREDAGAILTKFHAGGASLIFVWFLFAVMGIPLLIAYITLGQKLENKLSFIRWATTLGVISGIVQIIGLLRWTFVVPVLANDYVTATSDTSREAIKVIFHTVHQFGGVLLGEHVGQLFTVIWTVMMALAFSRLGIFSKWISWFGYISAGIYFLAQADLFRTVIPNFPVWGLAGMIGSSLWLIWLLIIGIKLLKVEIK